MINIVEIIYYTCSLVIDIHNVTVIKMPSSPFHNWRWTTLQHFAIGIFWPRISFYICCMMSRIHCMHFSGLIASSLFNMNTIQTLLNAIQIIAMQCTNVSTNVLQHFVYLQVMHDFKRS